MVDGIPWNPIVTVAGCMGATEVAPIICKRYQTNELAVDSMNSGPGGRSFKSSPPDQSFQAIIVNSAELLFVQLGATAFLGVVRHGIDPGAHGIAPHQPSIVGVRE
jgi:hypothetical protein